MRILYFRTNSGRQPVQEYIADLPDIDRAAIVADFELIRDMGIRDAPVVTRKLEGKLWEIKTGTHNQQRIFIA